MSYEREQNLLFKLFFFFYKLLFFFITCLLIIKSFLIYDLLNYKFLSKYCKYNQNNIFISISYIYLEKSRFEWNFILKDFQGRQKKDKIVKSGDKWWERE